MSKSRAEHPYERAWRTRDLSAWLTELDDEVVLRSPFLSRPFVGRNEAERLFRALFASIDQLDISGTWESDGIAVITWTGHTTVGTFDGVDVVHTGAAGLVDRIDVYIRPLTGISMFARTVTPALLRDATGSRRFLAAASSCALSPLFALIDRVARRLAVGRP